MRVYLQLPPCRVHDDLLDQIERFPACEKRGGYHLVNKHSVGSGGMGKKEVDDFNFLENSNVSY